MRKERLEAFSDGVLGIIITVMILEIKVPASGIYILVALIWLVPDRRIEVIFKNEEK
jgi:uncharacterized membrane protein